MSPVDYHAWTHLPKAQGGTDPIESSTDVPWARRQRTYSATVQAATSGSYTPFLLNQNINLGSGDSGFDWFEAETASSANGIKVLQDCFLVCTAACIWDTNPANQWWVWIEFDPPSTTTRLAQPHYAAENTTTVHGRFTTHERVVTNTLIHAGAWHNSGASRNIDASWLEVAVLGTWTGIEPGDTAAGMNPDNI